MAIEVNLMRHASDQIGVIANHLACREYKAWHDYILESDKPSAVLQPTEPILKQWSFSKRNMFRQSVKRGYASREISWAERSSYLTDIFNINTSKQMRQGKPLGESYQAQPKPITGLKTCEHHYSTFIACFAPDGRMRAYIAANFCGEMAAASQIMGHGDFLNDGIMINLWHEFVSVCLKRGIKFIVYSRWEDGLDGLKSWKRSVGMKPETIIEAV